MSQNPLIKYYEVLNPAVIWKLDDMNRVATPEKSKSNKSWMVEKGKYVKSFGQSSRYKTHTGKEELLTLVNGMGIKMSDVTLYADKVDDCGCDGNPVAKASDMEKLDDAVAGNGDHKKLDKESAYLGGKKSKFDKSALVGFFIGAVIGTLVLWFSTKDKKKTIIGAVCGAIIGLVIGYFFGKRGETKQTTVEKLDEIEKEADADNVEPVTAPKEKDSANNKEFLQLGETYDFALPNSVYAMTYGNGSFYVAKNKAGTRIKLNIGEVLKGKLVEVKDPQFFVPDPKSKKIIKVRSNKPLPFLDLGKKLYIPLSVVSQDSVIDTQQAMDFLTGGGSLDQEIYIKGRYAGKKSFNLMYMPTHDPAIRQMFGK